MEQDDILSCKCCLSVYNNPVYLACGHCVCFQCAERLYAYAVLCKAKEISKRKADNKHLVQDNSALPSDASWTSVDSLFCPLCNQVSPIPNGLRALPPNNELRAEVEKYTKYKRATTSEKGQYTNILTAQQAIPTCGFGCGKDATMECLTCQCAMCSECFGDLHKKPAFVHHESGALGDLERKKAPTCLVHKKELELYCLTCRGLVCVVCVTLSEEHKGHQCIPLEEYMETCKEEIVQGTDLLRARHTQLMIAVLSVERMIFDINKVNELFEKEVEETFTALIQALEQKKQDLLVSARKISSAKVDHLSHQLNCIRILADQLESTSNNLHTVSTQALPPSALLSTKRDMVIALKCFDPKHLLVSPCEENNFIFELEPLSVAQEIAKLGFVAEAGFIPDALNNSNNFNTTPIPNASPPPQRSTPPIHPLAKPQQQRNSPRSSPRPPSSKLHTKEP